jgi:hypothetical protein
MNRPNIAKLLMIGKTWIPGITKFNVSMEDIDGEGTQRSEIGIMHREVLRKKVKKLSINCTHDDPEILAVATLVEGDTFEATVFCPGDPNSENNYITTTFYISKITIDLMLFKDGKGIWSVAFNAVEV